jgi:hypothetical protein
MMHNLLATPGGTAAKLAVEKDRNVATCVRDLYLHALSRQPTDEELQIALAHIDGKKAKATAMDSSQVTQATKEAYEDIIWVVLNTKEFLFNH